jgi:hypothetical protein
MKTTPWLEILPYQPEFRPVLPTVRGNVDYLNMATLLHRMDEILDDSGAQALFVKMSLEQWEANSGKTPAAKRAAPKQRLKHQQHSIRALRCTVLKDILGEDYRGLSVALANSPLYQWFCGVDRLDIIRVPGKSLLQEYAHWLPEEKMRMVVNQLLCAALASDQPGKGSPLALANTIELETVWLDTTCVKANIHFPVDWVLLRDATRTLVKAINLIRQHGLKHRMGNPDEFLTIINRLCIQMTMSRRQENSRRERKRILRLMKKEVAVISRHAKRYRTLLDERWSETDWTRKQAEVVLRRIDGVLALLPQAKKQAHERIIGGRPVPNNEKILSLYESQVHVIVRGKAEAEVEFGNKLLLAEQQEGLIVDWWLYENEVPNDTTTLPGSLQRLREGLPVPLRGVGADRGFFSAKNQQELRDQNLFDGICPRDPQAMAQRLQERVFVVTQKRRAQTEGRIGIFKNTFLGRPLRAKGYANRNLAIVWNVLTHNLWVLARLPVAEAAEIPLKKAA